MPYGTAGSLSPTRVAFPLRKKQKNLPLFRGRFKITRRYLLSRFHNYHRLQALSFRIRDGNARFHLDIVAGSSDETLLKSRPKYQQTAQELRIARIIDVRDQIFVC